MSIRSVHDSQSYCICYYYNILYYLLSSGAYLGLPVVDDDDDMMGGKGGTEFSLTSAFCIRHITYYTTLPFTDITVSVHYLLQVNVSYTKAHPPNPSLVTALPTL